ncbi:hypothetical protein [Chlorogloeopsis fritschii]
MDAEDLLRRYGIGERDFHTVDLRGAKLQEVESEWDSSEEGYLV